MHFLHHPLQHQTFNPVKDEFCFTLTSHHYNIRHPELLAHTQLHKSAKAINLNTRFLRASHHLLLVDIYVANTLTSDLSFLITVVGLGHQDISS